jgi:hypothetical protein
VLHDSSHAVQGAVVFLMFGAGMAAKLVMSRFRSRRAVMAGLGVLLGALAPG